MAIPLPLKFEDKDKAEILQQQFCSVFTREPEGEIPHLEHRNPKSISSCRFTEPQIRKLLQQLSADKACGPDGLHPCLLKELSSEISGAICVLFNLSIATGRIPAEWKKAEVKPIFKKGSRHSAENYRPVSLTSILCKVLESLVRKVVMDHRTDSDILASQQYGFVAGRSTTLQLLHYLDKITEIIAAGGVVDSIYLDFSKAFDTVPHRRLLGKLDAVGVRGELLAWIKDFLSERTQFVTVNGESSEPADVISGIPQGSVLGPILFVIFINDMPLLLKCLSYLFADDTKAANQVRTEADARQLQSDLDELQRWSDLWLLRFHPGKCKVLTLGHHDNITHTHRYTLGGQELEHVFEEKDLGITIDAELTFDDHVRAKVRKANSMMGLLRRSFTQLTPQRFTLLYKSFVRSQLEYGQAVWFPYRRPLVHILEQVQIRATASVNGLANLTYEERLKRLKLTTLTYRRHRGDMIEIFKHFDKYDRAAVSASFNPRTRPHRGGSVLHSRHLNVKPDLDGHYGSHRNSFYCRAPKLWNLLPEGVVTAPSLDCFKARLDRHWHQADFRYIYLSSPPELINHEDEELLELSSET